MSWFVVGCILGLLIGFNMRDDKDAKTFEQLDEEVRKEYIRLKNLNESLLEDVKYWRNRYNTLHGIKDKK